MKLIRVKCKDVDVASRREEFLKTFSNLKINGKSPKVKILWNGPVYSWPINKLLEVSFDDSRGDIDVTYERQYDSGKGDATASFSIGWDIKKIVNFVKRKAEE